MRPGLTAVVFWAFLLKNTATASDWQWNTLTSVLHIQDLGTDGQNLWAGTPGGLLQYRLDSHLFSSWTNTEGLAANDATAVCSDETGRIWIGCSNGWLQIFEPETEKWTLITDYADHQINTLWHFGDSLFVGLDIGLSLYRISKSEVKETYRHLGNAFHVDIPIRCILVSGSEVWVGTDEGLAHSDLSDPNLLDPAHWENVTLSDGLPDSRVTALTVDSGRICVGTEGGMARLEQDEWHVLGDWSVVGLTMHGDTLTAASENGVFSYLHDSWEPIGESLSGITQVLSVGSTLWCGTTSGLIEYSATDHLWILHQPECMGSNMVSDVAVDAAGHLWCCSRDNGFSERSGSEWFLYDNRSVSGLSSNDFVTVAPHPNGPVWIGSWGKGAVRKDPEDGTFEFFNSANGFLAGISGDPTYSVVSDIAVDRSGTVWILNRESSTNKPLVSVVSDSVWTYYGPNEGIPTTFVRNLAVDVWNRKWIGSDYNGVLIYDDSGTPEDPSDDPPLETITTSDGLETNEISALAPDETGGMWIGTPVGLYSAANGSVTRIYGPPSDNVTALAIDGENNVWVGTDVGLALHFIFDNTWSYFTTDNSGLVGGEINALHLDLRTGILYAGTNEGLSILTTPFSKPRASLDSLRIYPNPFIPLEHGILTIDGLADGTTVSIFTPSGLLVRRMPDIDVHGKRTEWDGNDSEGHPVAGGMYVVVATTETGQNRAAKAALIR